MGRNSDGLVIGTGPGAIEVSEKVARLLDLRVNGYNLKQAAEICDIPYGTAQSWVRKYIRHVSSKAVIAFRDQELGKLEDMEERILQVLNREHYVTYKGEVAMVPDVNSPQLMNPITGQMEYVGRVPLIDSDPITRAVVAYLKISERKSKLLGADKAPDKSTDAAGGQKPEDAPTQTLTPEMFEKAMHLLSTKIGIKLNKEDAIDVDPVVQDAE